MYRATRTRLEATVLLTVGLLLVAGPALAQADADAAEVEVETAPVRIDGVPLFEVRGNVGVSAEQRAARLADRIVQAARDPAVDPEQLRVAESDRVIWIVAGDVKIAGVFEADARLVAMRREELAHIWMLLTRRAIQDYREARRPDALQAGLFVALRATLVLVVVLLLGRWVWRRTERWIKARIERAPAIGVVTFEILRADQVREVVWASLRGVRLIVLLTILYLYLESALGAFPWTRWIARDLAGLVIGPLATIGNGFLQWIPSFAFLVVLFAVMRTVLRLLGLFFAGVGRGTIELRNFDPAWAAPTFRLVRFAVIGFALVVAFPYLPGSSSPAFQGLSVMLGVLLSLGSSTVVANTIAGYSLTYRRAFKVGDVVRIGDVVGAVSAIRLQVTHVRTFKNEEVVLPNSKILGEAVVNYSTLARSKGLVLHTTVGIGYETPWRQVEAMLLMAAARTEGLAAQPAPFILQRSLGDFCVVYELNVGCDDAGRMFPLYSALHRSILDVFNEYGVQIMTPAYEGDPEVAKVVPRERWFAEPAAPPRDAAEGRAG